MIRPNTDAILHLTWKLLDAGRIDDAYKTARGHVEVSDSSATWHALAHTLQAKGQWADAIAALEKALTRAPADEDLKRRLDRVRRNHANTSQDTGNPTP